MKDESFTFEVNNGASVRVYRLRGCNNKQHAERMNVVTGGGDD